MVEIINDREYRNYTGEDVDQLLIVAELRKLNFSIEDIIEILDHPDEIKSILSRHYNRLRQEVSKKSDYSTLNSIKL